MNLYVKAILMKKEAT